MAFLISSLRPHAWRRQRLGAPCAVAILCCATLLALARNDPDEYQVKAAFIYNFAKFVTWPAQAFKGPSDPLVICVVGNDPFNGALEEAVRGKTIDGRPLAIKVMGKVDANCPCQILFVSHSGAKRSAAEVSSNGVLIIGESPGFAAKGGGVINFKLQDGRVRFEINPDAADRQQLHISSKLLSLADIVKDTR